MAETTSVSRRPPEPTAAEVHRAVDEFFLKAVTGVAVADLAGTVVQANPAFAALVGPPSPMSSAGNGSTCCP